MADIALVEAGKLRIVGIPNPQAQHTAVAAAELQEGDVVYLNTNGQWGKADDTTNDDPWGMVWQHAYAGEAVTAFRDGTIIDGFALSALAYQAKVYLSATAGRIADAGTLEIGEVVPAMSQPHGTVPDKVLKLTIDRRLTGT